MRRSNFRQFRLLYQHNMKHFQASRIPAHVVLAPCTPEGTGWDDPSIYLTLLSQHSAGGATLAREILQSKTKLFRFSTWRILPILALLFFSDKVHPLVL